MILSKKLIISRKYKFIYFEVPKCGTRTVLSAFNCATKYGVNNSNFDYKCKRIRWEKYKNRWDKYFKFTFVRNPFDRIVSCYISKVVNPIPIQIDVLLKPYGLWANMSFTEFVEKICESDNYNEHWAPQYLLIPEVDFIGKVENFNNDILYITTKIGIEPLNIKIMNSSNIKNYNIFYNEKNEKLIREKYKQDFKLLGYKDAIM